MQSFFPGKRKTFMILVGFFLISSNVSSGKKTKGKCSACQDIAKNFHRALKTTAKSNYGGGNTGWEEKSLGSYRYSEVRLVEVIEKLCDDSAKECHSVLEEHEEVVERFWFKEFAQKKETDFYAYVCIDHLQLCCPNNTYGKDCSPCPGGVVRPCNGNGACDGDGTRDGTGQCRCNSGYQGEKCLECKDGFYEESSNETHTECKVCHIACKNICSEGGPKGCDECKEGWKDNDELGCQDIDECATAPCDENQYCSNTQGSYTCFSCDEACESCSGPGAKNCKECHSGFTQAEDSSECLDDNECDLDTNLCPGENEMCKNTPGSYECACQTGFVRRDNICVPPPKEKVESKRKLETPPNLKEQLQKQLDKRQAIDWSKYKDNPSVLGHFLVMGIFGLSCYFASSSRLAIIALTALMITHVVWFATTSR